MRTGAARGQAGHFHEAGFYGSDAEFRALIVPFAEEGIAAGEPVILGYDDRKSALLRSWLSDPSAVDFVGDEGLYAKPARAIKTYRRLFEFHLALGAGQIRIAGDVPHPGNGGWFEGWDRYEAAVNTVWQDFPVWGRCLYDATTAPPAVVDVVERTHPRIVSPSGQRRKSDRYQNPPAFEGLPYVPDPLEGSTPVAELADRPAADARHALAAIARGRMPGTVVQDLLIGVTEAVTNAQRHGRPPVTVRIWAAGDRVVVTVHDTGRGPADRLAGLVPVPSSTPDRHLGLGLWVTHQLDIDLTLGHGADGFTVRLRHLPGLSGPAATGLSGWATPGGELDRLIARRWAGLAVVEGGHCESAVVETAARRGFFAKPPSTDRGCFSSLPSRPRLPSLRPRRVIPVTDLPHPVGPVIVRLPAEIDLANAEDVGEQLRSAFTPGVTVVIADLTATVFCDSAGLRQFILAHQYADARDAHVRFAIPHRSTLRVLTLTGYDQLLSIYPSLGAAVAVGPALDGDAASG